MFAEKESQGQGLGKEALLSMMHYGGSFGFLALFYFDVMEYSQIHHNKPAQKYLNNGQSFGVLARLYFDIME